MNFIVSTTTLLRQLKSISGVLASNNTLPIFENFLFSIEAGTLTISASDMESTIITSLKVEANENGNICIPAKPLIETLSNFPEQPLTFSIDKSRFGVKIITDNGEYKLTGHNGEDFPRLPLIESSFKIETKCEVISTAINKTLFATGSDELRPVMNGVFFQFNENEALFVSTDAHKLVKYTRHDAKATESAAFIVPKKPLNLLKNLLGGNLEAELKLEYNKTNASFTFANYTVVCRLIDGKYPNYDAVIPKVNPNKLTLDRDAFVGALRRVSIFANKATHQIRLKIAGSQLHLSAEDLDFANEAYERLNCQYEGTDMEIGFNSKFLLEMLLNITSNEIIIEMSAPNRAGIIVPMHKENPSEDVLMLVMPVMLNN